MLSENNNITEISTNIKNNVANFQLFTSPKDKMTQDIFEVSNPFEFILPQYMDLVNLSEKNKIFNLDGGQLLNLGSTSNSLKELLFSNRNGIIYKPDFDKLSIETQNKLKSGIYKIGESKKVKGNLRAVIVDTTNSNQRVEDITLKEVTSNGVSLQDINNVAIQVQLKQIYEILLDIQETQDYQLHWDRNNSILTPFFTARLKIIEIQTTDDWDKKIKLLDIASNYLEESVSAVKSDLLSNKKMIEKLLNKPSYNYSRFEKHTNFILNDFNLLLKLVGIQIYIDLTLDNKAIATERVESVKYIFESYSSKVYPESKGIFYRLLNQIPLLKKTSEKLTSKESELISLIEIIHDNYKYSTENTDLWLKINDEMQNGRQLSLLIKGDSDYAE